MKKKVIILGITGLTGNLLAKALLEDENYEEIISFHRRKSGINHPKLTEYMVNMDQLEDENEHFKADVVFCCVGTTKAKTRDKDAYKAVDYGIPLQAARLCEQNNIPTIIVISAMGANPNSRIFYNRIKGEMERDLLKLNIPHTYLLEPALLAGNREEKRTGERVAIAIFKLLNPLLRGPLRKYQSIKPETLVKTMQKLAKNRYNANQIESDKIKEIANYAGNRTKI